jgi:hypothetical protein
MAHIEYLDDTTKKITPEMAQQLREAWVMRDNTKLTEEQLNFLNRISKIHYAPEDVYCLHRFVLDKTIPGFRGSKFYVMKCPQCKETFSTDKA